jgi:hypothetical protein
MDSESTHRTPLRISAGDEPLWLCFEPWATGYTVPAQTTVVVMFDTDQTPVEMVHRPDGVTFFSLGTHPDVWSATGQPLELFSEVMPVTPSDLSTDAGSLFKLVMSAVPPMRSDENPSK